MLRGCIVAVLAAALALTLSQGVRAMGTETRGNGALSALNYTEWKGIMPLVNDRARVYEIWINGNEHLYYKGGAKELNVALANFAKVEVKNHVVVLRPGPAVRHGFDQTAYPYDWELHVIGGIARRFTNDNIEDLDRQKDPVLTVVIGGDIDLNKIEFPKGLTLRAAPANHEQPDSGVVTRKRIADFLEARARNGQK